jgi:hypothetical protein
MIIQKEIKIGWKKLKSILEDFRKALNHNQPVSGNGIVIHETDTGCIISLEKLAVEAEAKEPPIMAGRWTPVTIVDPTTCAQSTLYVWALPK